jgi:hypothetical protein
MDALWGYQHLPEYFTKFAPKGRVREVSMLLLCLMAIVLLQTSCISIHHGDVLEFPSQNVRISCFESNDLNQSRLTAVSCVFENQSNLEVNLEVTSVRAKTSNSGYLLPLNAEETGAAVSSSLQAAGIATSTQSALGVAASSSALQRGNQRGSMAAGGAAVLLSEKNEANRIEILKTGYKPEGLIQGSIRIEPENYTVRRLLFPYDLNSKSSRQVELCIKPLQPECSPIELNRAAATRQRG